MPSDGSVSYKGKNGAWVWKSEKKKTARKDPGNARYDD